MKPIGSVTTGLAQQKTQPSSTGKPHGEHGLCVQSSAQLPASNVKPPALGEVRQWLPLLTESLTSLNLVHTRTPDGKNYTERKHTLMVSVQEAKQKLSMLTAMCSPAAPSEVSEVLKRLFVLPSGKADEDHVAEVWMMSLEGQPISSIVYAFNKFIRDTGRKFRPAPGEFLAVVDEHAKRVRHKAKTLSQAINSGE